MMRRFTFAALALTLGAAHLAAFAQARPTAATTLKATLLAPLDDARLERTRLERAYLGHTGGPLLDALQMALDENQLELESAGLAIAISTQGVATLAKVLGNA